MFIYLRKNFLSFIAVALSILLVATSFHFLSQGFAVDSSENNKGAYAEISLTNTRDGTGHGTDAGTFITTNNGFSVGDDTPTDGVVSSGDYVSTHVELRISAAQERTIIAGFDASSAPFLEPVAGGGFCSSSSHITTRFVDGKCYLHIPSGVTETLSFEALLKAKDTQGRVEKDQTVKFFVEREDNSSSRKISSLRSFTVVSAPAADLAISLQNKSGGGHFSSWKQDQDIQGSLNIHVEKLHYPHFNTLGASIGGSWSGNLDVSSFPEGTQWYEYEPNSILPASETRTSLTVDNGIIHLENKQQGLSLLYTIPFNAIADMKEGGSRSWDVHLTTGKDVFRSHYGDDVLLNLGTGGEPGGSTGKNDSTYNGDIGSLAGSDYPNNNWGKIIVFRDFPQPKGSIFSKKLEIANVPGATIFDNANKVIEDNTPVSRVFHYDNNDLIARNSDVRTILSMITHDLANVASDKIFTFEDVWTAGEQDFRGHLEVIQGDRVLYENRDYTVQWNDTNTNKWINGYPGNANTHIKGIRIHVRASSVQRDSESPDINVRFITRVKDSTNVSNIVSDRFSGDFEGSISTDTKPITEYVRLTDERDLIAGEIDHTVTVYDKNNIIRKDNINVYSGDIAHYVVSSHNVKNVYRFSDTIHPVITIEKPVGIHTVTNTSQMWDMREEKRNNKTYLIFTMKSAYTETLKPNRVGEVSIPSIRYTAIVGNKASRVVSSPATLAITRNDDPTTYESNTSVAQFTVNNTTSNSGSISAQASIVDVREPLTWNFNIYSRGENHTGTSTTVIRFPSNDDSVMTGDNNTGLDGSWNEYNLSSSSYHGSYRIENPVSLNTEQSTETTILYSTSSSFSYNVNDYTWKTWDDLTQEDKNHVTAIQVVSRVESSSGDTFGVSSAEGNITLIPTDNIKDDTYYMWIGGSVFSDNQSGNNDPFPAVIQAKSSTIKGTVWWDRNASTKIDTHEEKISGVEVSLWATNEQGVKQGSSPVKTVETSDDGSYIFDDLHSGNYLVEVKRSEGTVTDTGVQTKNLTYFNQEKDVTITRSYRSTRERATNSSGAFYTPIGSVVDKVDFGFFKEDPKATLDKEAHIEKCDDFICYLSWDVTVRNEGKTTSAFSGLSTFDNVLIKFGNDYTKRLFLNTEGKPQLSFYSANISNVGEESFVSVVSSPDYMTAYLLSIDGEVYKIRYNSSNYSLPLERDLDIPESIRGHIVRIAETGNSTTNIFVTDTNDVFIKDYGLVHFNGDKPDFIHATSLLSHKANDEHGVFVQIFALGNNNVMYQCDIRDFQGECSTVSYGNNVSIKDIELLNKGNTLRVFSLSTDGQTFLYNPGEKTSKVSRLNIGNIVSLFPYDGNAFAFTGGRDEYSYGIYTVGKTVNNDVHTELFIESSQFGALPYSVVNDYDGYDTESYDFMLPDGSIYSTNNDIRDPQKDESFYNIATRGGINTTVRDNSSSSYGTSSFPASSTLTDIMDSSVLDVKAVATSVTKNSSDIRISHWYKDDGVSQIRFFQDNDGRDYVSYIPNDSRSNIYDVTPLDFSIKSFTPAINFYDEQQGRDYFYIVTKDHTLKRISFAWTTEQSNRVYDYSSYKIEDVSLGFDTIEEYTREYKNSSLCEYVFSNNTWYEQCHATPYDESHTDNTSWVAATNDSGSPLIAKRNRTTIYEDQVHGLFEKARIVDSIFSGDAVAETNQGMFFYKNGYNSSFIKLQDDPLDTDMFTFDRNNFVYLDSSGDAHILSYSSANTDEKVVHLDDVRFVKVSGSLNGDGFVALGDNGALYEVVPRQYWSSRLIPQELPKTLISTIQHNGAESYVYAVNPGFYYSLPPHVGINNYPIFFTSPEGLTAYNSQSSRELYSRESDVARSASVLEPREVSEHDGITKRIYNLPSDINPGGYVTYHFTGRVLKTEKEQYIKNQAFFDSPDTPYSGTPTAFKEGKNIPDLPSLADNPNPYTGFFHRNPTCLSDYDYGVPEMEHYFSLKQEDICEQTETTIPSLPRGTTPVLGSISGEVWEDRTRNDILDPGELRIIDARVYLFRTDSDNPHEAISETRTDDTGEYYFPNLPEGEYRVVFERNDGKILVHNYSHISVNPDMGSHASTDTSTYGQTEILTISSSGTLDIEHINAGFYTIHPSISVIKTINNPNVTAETGKSNGRSYIVQTNKENTVQFFITNNGDEKLMDVSMADKTTLGRDHVQNIVCPWRKENINGIDRNVLDPQESILCAGTLTVRDTSLNGEPVSSDTVTVTAVGVTSMKNVSDNDNIVISSEKDIVHGEYPDNPQSRIPQTGSIGVLILITLAIIIAISGAIVLIPRKKDKEDTKNI